MIPEVTLPGPVRPLRNKDLDLLDNRHRHSLSEAVGPCPTRAQAEKELRARIDTYAAQTWPGGCVTGRWLIYWSDAGTWSGVFESYYSFS